MNRDATTPEPTRDGDRASVLCCGRCGAVLGRKATVKAAFCGSCGAAVGATRDGPRRRATARDDAAGVRRASTATAILFVGVLMAVAVGGRIDGGGVVGQVVAYLGFALAGLLACVRLGPDSIRTTVVPGNAKPMHLAVGAGVGVATFAASWLWVAAISWLVRAGGSGIWDSGTGDSDVGSGGVGSGGVDPITVVSAVVLAPLLEEWLCRGVLWSALAPHTRSTARIPASAALFALLHGLQGLLWLPHRFVAGLALGVLRERSGSLIPGIVAHAVHNLLAVVAWA